MAAQDWLGITEKTLKAIESKTAKELDTFATALDRSFAKVGKEMIRLYNNLEGADPQYIQVQLSKLKQITIARQLVTPKMQKEFEISMEKILEQSTADGIRYGDLMIQALTNPPELVRQFGEVPINAAAIAVQSGRRLRNHSKDAADTILTSVSTNLLQGGSIQKLTKDIQGALGTTKARSENIARTESSIAFNKASQQRYEDYGTKYVQIIALVDNRTTMWCRYRHLKIIKISQSQPPYHFQCRSTIAPVDPAWIDKDDLKWMNEERKRAQETGLSFAGAAPFDTKKPGFIAPSTFVKTVKIAEAPKKQVENTDIKKVKEIAEAVLKGNLKAQYPEAFQKTKNIGKGLKQIIKQQGLKVVGSGDLGIVVDLGNDRVAKIVYGTSDDQSISKKSKQEFEISKKAGDTGVGPKVFDFGDNYLISEKVSKKAFSDFKKEFNAKRSGAFNLEESLKFYPTLQKLHEQGIIHNDLLKQNMYRENGKNKFIDFGESFIAKDLGDVAKEMFIIMSFTEGNQPQYVKGLPPNLAKLVSLAVRGELAETKVTKENVKKLYKVALNDSEDVGTIKELTRKK